MAGLYIHVPFCSQRCSYCDFYFVTTARSHAPFVEALRREIELVAAEYAGREPIRTIYFGGGTPSLLDPGDLATILDAVHDAFDTSSVEETTLELNPENGSESYLRDLRSLGIDRLSIGVQSFFDQDLGLMNRVHSAEIARQVIGNVHSVGFESFSIDLIFGLPDQPAEYWSANLEIANALEIPHISTYSLTLEEGTPLWKSVQRGVTEPADDDVVTDRFLFAMDYLASHGYEHYEISSFALPGHRAVHNHRYWEHANYLGFGPSAHSFWWQGLPARRWQNVRNLKRYEALLMQHVAPVEQREKLSLDMLADEYIMLRLRTDGGLDMDELEDRYGVDLLIERVDDLAHLEKGEFIHPIRNRRIRLTDVGKTVADSVTARLLPRVES